MSAEIADGKGHRMVLAMLRTNGSPYRADYQMTMDSQRRPGHRSSSAQTWPEQS